MVAFAALDFARSGGAQAEKMRLGACRSPGCERSSELGIGTRRSYMVVLRATRRVLKTLTESAPENVASDTALGDWYVNRIVVDRKPLLLLVSAASLLAVLTPARRVRTLPDRIADLVAERLEGLRLEPSLVAAEVQAMDVAYVGRTSDRSVIGTMVDFARAIPYYLPVNGWDEASLRLAEERLSETPCRCARRGVDVIFPARTAIQLLKTRWGSGGTIH